MIRSEEAGNPIQIEPPDGIGQILADSESRRLAARNQTHPGNLRPRRIRRIALNVCQLRARNSRVRLWSRVKRIQEAKPQKTDAPGQNKSPCPTEMRAIQRNDDRV